MRQIWGLRFLFRPLETIEARSRAYGLPPLLQTVYDEGNFDLRVDYTAPVPEPALSESDRAWVQECLGADE